MESDPSVVTPLWEAVITIVAKTEVSVVFLGEGVWSRVKAVLSVLLTCGRGQVGGGCGLTMSLTNISELGGECEC